MRKAMAAWVLGAYDGLQPRGIGDWNLGGGHTRERQWLRAFLRLVACHTPGTRNLIKDHRVATGDTTVIPFGAGFLEAPLVALMTEFEVSPGCWPIDAEIRHPGN